MKLRYKTQYARKEPSVTAQNNKKYSKKLVLV
jgi:hypothetical protein